MKWNRNNDLNDKHIKGTMTWHKNRLFILGSQGEPKTPFNNSMFESQVEWLGKSSIDFCHKLINAELIQ